MVFLLACLLLPSIKTDHHDIANSAESGIKHKSINQLKNIFTFFVLIFLRIKCFMYYEMLLLIDNFVLNDHQVMQCHIIWIYCYYIGGIHNVNIVYGDIVLLYSKGILYFCFTHFLLVYLYLNM